MSQSLQLFQSDVNTDYFQVLEEGQELGYFWKQGDGWFWNLSLPDAGSQIPDRIPGNILQVAAIAGEEFKLEQIIAIFVAQEYGKRLKKLSVA